MKPADYSIETGAIALRSPSALDVQRARQGFLILFGEKPRITIRGLFPAGSVKNHALEELRLLDPPAPSVVIVGRLYLTIEGPALGHTARRMIDPTKGRNVEVRLRLPEEGTPS